MWSKEDLASATVRGYAADECLMGLTDAVVMAIMSYAVELAAARGGTMTAGALEGDLLTVASRLEALPDTAARLRQHIAALGAKVTALEAQLATERAGDLQLRQDLGAAPDETLRGVATRVLRERDDALSRPAPARWDLLP